MFIAEEDCILFGKLIKKGEKFNNIFGGKIYKKEEIIKKMQEKKIKFKEIKENKENKETKEKE